MWNFDLDKILKLIKSYGPYIVIYILLLFIGYQCTRKPEPEDPVITESDHKIDEKQAVIPILLAKVDELVKKGKEDSVKAAKRERALQHKLEALQKKEPELRADIQPAIDTIPKLAAYVALRDSIDAVKDKQLIQARLEKIQLRKDFDTHLKLDDEMFTASIGINEHLKEQVGIYRDKNRKLRRQNNALKVIAVGLTLAAILKQ